MILYNIWNYNKIMWLYNWFYFVLVQMFFFIFGQRLVGILEYIIIVVKLNSVLIIF